ncbi:MAG TPA: carbon-nitrogen hydrolase family protein [Candidatus Latescibacteria bacterium]|nr:hypothetical protein [Gemmatimonadaceae bacterium]MDP6014991.1 carbon-nitrogen hydrolase family protein [Candidatus Latescibacterota bacterium]HJP33531.1 carbon-nitrogen hydrolase family protein [Candidatus Latescibacterota bacterium]
MRVAGFQMRVTADVVANEQALLGAVERAGAAGADILLTPEGSLSGYTSDFDHAAVMAALSTVTAAARDLRLGLALGTCFVEDDDLCYNQIRFHDREGEFLGFHAKTLTCGTLTEPPRGEVERFSLRPLSTRLFAGVTTGGLICNDLWANPGCTPTHDPHLTQQLASAGARIIFHAVNGGRDGSQWSQVAWQYHESNLRLRARAGDLWIVTVDSCEPVDIPCSSPSGIIDPRGEWVCRTATKGEELFVHDIDVAEQL